MEGTAWERVMVMEQQKLQQKIVFREIREAVEIETVHLKYHALRLRIHEESPISHVPFGHICHFMSHPNYLYNSNFPPFIYFNLPTYIILYISM